MAGLDINAPYSNSKQAEVMTAGHKLSLEIVQHPQTPAPAKIEGVKAALECGLDVNARWREGRASGIVGATLLAATLWLQGVTDEAKLELARRLVIEQGLQVNIESVERATKASSGTFVLAGAINCSSLQSQSKAELLSIMVAAGLDLNATCHQGKEQSTTGSTLSARVAAAAGMRANDQIVMLTTLVRGGWRPSALGRSDLSKLANVVPLSRHPSVDPALLGTLQQEIAKCESGDWSWASHLVKDLRGEGNNGGPAACSMPHNRD